MKKRNPFAKTVILFLIMLSVLLSGCGESSPDAEAEDAGPAEVLQPVPDAPENTSPAVSDREITVEITEVMFSNRTSIRDSYGCFSDWIEFENKGTEACSLEGFWLSDSGDERMKWRFPDVSVAPGERLIVFCSERESTENELHTGFSLSKEDETLYFSYPSGAVRTAVRPSEMPGGDISLCIEGNSSYTTYDATPGYPNTEEGRLAFIEADDRHGDLVINEACPFNETYRFLHGGYYDWLELRNVSSSSINLRDYTLTDDPDEPTKYRLPDTVLKPGKKFMVLCSGEKDLSRFKVCWYDFALDTAGDAVYIYDSAGNLSDKAGVYNVPLRGSIGRLDGQAGFFLFRKATPEAQNFNGFRFRTERPEALTAPGVYNDIDSLSVELTGSGTIYYTLDGTSPSEYGIVYSGPISLNRTTVIRAMAVENGKMISSCASFSYIINEHHSLPVVSVSCEPGQFRRVYYSPYDHSKYCDASVSYFGEDGSFSADCAMKLHGSSARTVLLKKHYKLVFSGRYGGDLQYNLFGSDKFVGLHSFTLRGGELDNLRLVKDSLVARIANGVSPQDPFALDARYCILYINGDYWGIYALREAFSGTYVETHTEINRDAAVIIRAPELGDKSPEFYSLYKYISSNDMQDDACYSYVDERFDLRSLALWLCLESYFNNADPTGNIRYFRDDVSANSKWKVMLFDFDISLGNMHARWNRVTESRTQIGAICRSLLKSDRFRTLLLETASQLIENGLSDEYCLEAFHSLIDEIEPESQRNLLKWGERRLTYEQYKEHIVKAFSGGRLDSWLSGLQAFIRADDGEMAAYFPDYY